MVSIGLENEQSKSYDELRVLSPYFSSSAGSCFAFYEGNLSYSVLIINLPRLEPCTRRKIAVKL
jgi:hypothetical protein